MTSVREVQRIDEDEELPLEMSQLDLQSGRTIVDDHPARCAMFSTSALGGSLPADVWHSSTAGSSGSPVGMSDEQILSAK